MIYFDNSATTFPKPQTVVNAMTSVLQKYGANPGRSGHDMAKRSNKIIWSCRETAAKLFGAHKPENVIFTYNCTTAINMVIKGLLKPGDHVVTSHFEHNAVMRPLKKLEKIGVTYTQATVHPGNDDKTIDEFRNAINSKTALIIAVHASNVFGIRLPIERLSALSKIYGIPILVDAAQTAGVLPIDIKNSNIDYLCTAGHKGLYGPMGTGLLITNKGNNLETIIEGGTGTDSMKFCQPDLMPQKFESGTPNLPGIAGLNAGMEFVLNKGVNNIFNHEHKLITRLYDNLKSLKNIKLYTKRPNKEHFVPILSFNTQNYISDDVGKILNKNGIEVRTGLQCAPSAHEFYGTLNQGVIRVSPSIFNTPKEIDKLSEIIKHIT